MLERSRLAARELRAGTAGRKPSRSSSRVVSLSNHLPEGGAMSEGKSAMHTEDIELDETTAESVVGGYAIRNITLEQALKQGCVEIECMHNGSLMRDKKGHEFLIPYKKH
jgi:hypothetical protein